jgi:dihydroorotase-like cyclic amidohydrolase
LTEAAVPDTVKRGGIGLLTGVTREGFLWMGDARCLVPALRVGEFVTAAPARSLGPFPRAGALAVDADADAHVAVVRLDAITRPAPATLRSRAAGCGIVWDGVELVGRVHGAIVGGEVVVFHGKRLAGRRGTTMAGAATSPKGSELVARPYSESGGVA